jgi:proteic killer suppression protein
MIKPFAGRRTEDLFTTGTAKRFPADVRARAVRMLEYVHLATRLDDLRVPPGNRRHTRKDDRQGQHAIAVNDQWRICCRFVDGHAYDVEVCDYH